MMVRRTSWGLMGGGIIFFLLSWGLFYLVPHIHYHQDIDSGAYLQAAHFFLEDGSFQKLHAVPYYGLGYPFLLALLKKIGGNSLGFIIAVQALLGWFLALLVWRISDQLFNRKAAWIGYFLAITNIGILVFVQFLLTEIVLTLLLSIAAERILTFLRWPRLHLLFTAGVCLALSCTVKAVALFFMLPLFIFIGTCSQKKLRIRALSILWIAFGLPYGSYQLFTALTFQQAGRSMVGINLCYWYYPHLRAHINGTSSDEERYFLQHKVPYNEVLPMLAKDVLKYPVKAILALAKNWIKTLAGLYSTHLKLLMESPYFWAGRSFFHLRGSWIARGVEYITGRTTLLWVKGIALVEAFMLLLRYFVIPFGLLVLYRKRRWRELIFVMLYVGYFIGISGHDGCARFRMMSELLLLALAAGGAIALWYGVLSKCRTLE